MTSAESLQAVRQAILEIAPDLSTAELELSVDLHDDLGLDSIDLVNVAGAISDLTGIEIPDADYTRLHRIGDLVDFVEAHDI